MGTPSRAARSAMLREKAPAAALAVSWSAAMLRAASTRQAPPASVSRMKPRSAEVRSRTVSRMRSSRMGRRCSELRRLLIESSLRSGSGCTGDGGDGDGDGDESPAASSSRNRRASGSSSSASRRSSGVRMRISFQVCCGAVEAGERGADGATADVGARGEEIGAKCQIAAYAARGVPADPGKLGETRGIDGVAERERDANGGRQPGVNLVGGLGERACVGERRAGRGGAGRARLFGFGERFGEVERGGQAIAGGRAGEDGDTGAVGGDGARVVAAPPGDVAGEQMRVAELAGAVDGAGQRRDVGGGAIGAFEVADRQEQVAVVEERERALVALAETAEIARSVGCGPEGAFVFGGFAQDRPEVHGVDGRAVQIVGAARQRQRRLVERGGVGERVAAVRDHAAQRARPRQRRRMIGGGPLDGGERGVGLVEAAEIQAGEATRLGDGARRLFAGRAHLGGARVFAAADEDAAVEPARFVARARGRSAAGGGGDERAQPRLGAVEIAGSLQRARGGERGVDAQLHFVARRLDGDERGEGARVVAGESARLTEEQRGAQAGAAGAELLGVLEHGDGGAQLAALDQAARRRASPRRTLRARPRRRGGAPDRPRRPAPCGRARGGAAPGGGAGQRGVGGLGVRRRGEAQAAAALVEVDDAGGASVERGGPADGGIVVEERRQLGDGRGAAADGERIGEAARRRRQARQRRGDERRRDRGRRGRQHRWRWARRRAAQAARTISTARRGLPPEARCDRAGEGGVDVAEHRSARRATAGSSSGDEADARDAVAGQRPQRPSSTSAITVDARGGAVGGERQELLGAWLDDARDVQHRWRIGERRQRHQPALRRRTCATAARACRWRRRRAGGRDALRRRGGSCRRRARPRAARREPSPRPPTMLPAGARGRPAPERTAAARADRRRACRPDERPGAAPRRRRRAPTRAARRAHARADDRRARATRAACRRAAKGAGRHAPGRRRRTAARRSTTRRPWLRATRDRRARPRHRRAPRARGSRPCRVLRRRRRAATTARDRRAGSRRWRRRAGSMA